MYLFYVLTNMWVRITDADINILISTNNSCVGQASVRLNSVYLQISQCSKTSAVLLIPHLSISALVELRTVIHKRVTMVEQVTIDCSLHIHTVYCFYLELIYH